MSIPSIFSPENIDTMLFVDGGVIRNFPVQEVKDMGADYVIELEGNLNKITRPGILSH